MRNRGERSATPASRLRNYPPLARAGFRWFFRGMGRSDLERLSREELIELVLRMQTRPLRT
jgi:hypothetical protein